MRLITMLACSVVLTGCLGTRVLDIDRTNEADRYTVVEAAGAQSGEIVTDGDVIRFKKNQLQVTRDTLRVDPRGRRSKGQISVPLNDGLVEVRFRYRGSPLGALIGVLAGTGVGYLASNPGSSRASTDIGDGLARIGFTAGGGLLGAILGAFVGPKKTTIYRFHPHTPQQMSVVIGVGRERSDEF